jgi:hypothetical protein
MFIETMDRRNERIGRNKRIGRNERIGRNDIISGPLWGLVLFIGCQRHPINKIVTFGY